MCEAFKGIQINYRIIFIFYFILIFPYFFETNNKLVINKMNEMIFFSNAFVVFQKSLYRFDIEIVLKMNYSNN